MFGLVHGPVSGLEQALLNLALNARDAIEGVGVVEITTTSRHVEPTGESLGKVLPGHHVAIGFEDSGRGIPEEVVSRVFDAFFTTKEVGQGTGLGLKVVQDLAASAGGTVSVYSRPGRGTRFELLLPASQEAVPDAHPPRVPRETTGDANVVYALTHQDDLARAMGRALLGAGFEYHSAPVASEGVFAMARHHSKVDVVLVDLAHARQGLATARALLSARPGLRVLFLTDPTATISDLDEFVGPGFGTVLKPFSRGDLIEAIQDVLAR